MRTKTTPLVTVPEEAEPMNTDNAEARWDEEIFTEVVNKLPVIKETTPSLLSRKLNSLAKELGIQIDLERFSSQSNSSRMGDGS